MVTMTAVGKMLTAAALASMAASATAQTPAVRNVVLVHGAFADGSGWRGVYDELTRRGYQVTIVQNPLTSLADDVAATRRALDRQDGPAVLVGHSWGGTVVTEAGVHSSVAALVFVSALSPDAGETTGQQYAGFAPTPEFVIETHESGFGYLSPARFKAGFAHDVSDGEAAFLKGVERTMQRRTLMTPALPKPIADYVEANAQLDVDGMLKPFAADAVLSDNVKRHEGRAELRTLFEDEVIVVKAIFTPDAVRHEDGEVVVEGPAHGDFKGSPIRFTYRFTLENDAIKALEITL